MLQGATAPRRTRDTWKDDLNLDALLVLSRSAQLSQSKMYELEINVSCHMLLKLRDCLLTQQEMTETYNISQTFLHDGVLSSLWSYF